MNRAVEAMSPDPRGAGYEGVVTIAAPREGVFEAINTIEGLRGWWTPLVSGATAAGSELRFEFEGLDEHIVMRVDRASPPAAVDWTCLVHTGAPEWNGSTVSFELSGTPDACRLTLRHSGVAPETVARGWDHFLASVAAFIEDGEGMPYREG